MRSEVFNVVCRVQTPLLSLKTSAPQPRTPSTALLPEIATDRTQPLDVNSAWWISPPVLPLKRYQLPPGSEFTEVHSGVISVGQPEAPVTTVSPETATA